MVEPLEFGRRSRATRISVSGSGGVYLVRVDGSEPYRVQVRGGDARCECGAARCVHIASLHACGFMDVWNSGSDEARAA
jgi:uncharacterized Zn finger protein